MNYIALIDSICNTCGTHLQEHDPVAPYKCKVKWDNITLAGSYNFKSYTQAGKHSTNDTILNRARKLLGLPMGPTMEEIRQITCAYCFTTKPEHTNNVTCARAWHGGRATVGYSFTPYYNLMDMSLTALMRSYDLLDPAQKNKSGGARMAITNVHISQHNCKCGAWSTGVQDFEPGHSDWCRVHPSKKAKK